MGTQKSNMFDAPFKYMVPEDVSNHAMAILTNFFFFCNLLIADFILILLFLEGNSRQTFAITLDSFYAGEKHILV